MMDHTRYRSAILADPHDPDSELQAHLAACPECRAFTEKLLRFESRLERALRVSVAPSARVLPFARKAVASPPRRWMAMAASVLLGLGIAAGIWLTLPQRSLAADVLAHMAGEPDAWHTVAAVPAPELDAVLQRADMRLEPGAGIVSYAQSCPFRGRVVPHLVVQRPLGPVTVMVLEHETVRAATDFDEQGYRGTIVPIPGHGSIAVLMQGPGVSRSEVEQIAAQVGNAILWTR
ncbi:MAG: DUF3379 domain-containing protein [Pseudomonadota bacterium]|nr:DUF3379 domain-containing protein [Pseudomonadota bacterium]